MGIQFHSEFPFIRTTINLGWIIDPLMSWGSTRSMRVLYPKALHLIRLAFPTGPSATGIADELELELEELELDTTGGGQ